MITRIATDLVNSAAAANAPPHPPVGGALIRVALFTNARLDEDVKAKLLDEGFAVQVSGEASLRQYSSADIDADVVAIDWSLPGLSSLEAMAQVRFQSVNAPVVFLNGLASITTQVNYSSDVV